MMMTTAMSCSVQQLGDEILDEMSDCIFYDDGSSFPDGLIASTYPIPAEGKQTAASTSSSSSMNSTEREEKKKQKPSFFASKFDFPFRLHEMLNAVDKTEDDKEHISWMPGGRSFMILDCNRFADKTLPKFFVGIQYKSFIRQLNIYGFQRVKDRTSPKFGQYAHPMFVRGEPDLCLFMTRQKVKGTGVPRGKTKTKGGLFVDHPFWTASQGASSAALLASSLVMSDGLTGEFTKINVGPAATTAGTETTAVSPCNSMCRDESNSPLQPNLDVLIENTIIDPTFSL